MLDATLGIVTLVIACAVFLVLGLTYAWRRRRQSVEDYTTSRNHAPVNVGIATLVASMFGTWVLLSPRRVREQTSASFPWSVTPWAWPEYRSCSCSSAPASAS